MSKPPFEYESREDQGWAEALLYVEGLDASNRDEVMDDFMTGWRTADRTRESWNEEWIATLESLVADVYTILKPLATQGTQATSSPILAAYALLDAQDYTKRAAK